MNESKHRLCLTLTHLIFSDLYIEYVSFSGIFSQNKRVQPATVQQSPDLKRASSTWTTAGDTHSQRPSSLKISEPKPVPLPSHVRRAIKPASSLPQKSTSIPRSQPISMKRSDQRNSNDTTNMNNTAATAPSAINMSSISPPAVQFALGSPPIGSRRSASGGSLSESPPVAPYLWQISPTAQQSPPIRQPSATQLLQQGNDCSFDRV